VAAGRKLNGIWCLQRLLSSFQIRSDYSAASAFKWLEDFADEPVAERAVVIRPIYNSIGATRYILKGVHPGWAKHLAIEPVPQGEIVGKRSGFSRSLGPALRRDGYRPRRHLS
jgi:hypothetical protein